MSLNKVEMVWEIFDINDLEVVVKHKSFISSHARKVERIIRCPRCYGLILSALGSDINILPKCTTICLECGSRLEISERFIRCGYLTTLPLLDRLLAELNIYG